MAVVPTYSWSDPSLKEIDDVVNRMDLDATPSNGLVNSGSGLLIVDTNILIGYLDVLQDFVNAAEQHGIQVTTVVPGIVVVELDQQKKLNDALGWAARRASAWILEKIQARGSKLRGQPYAATLQSSGNWKVRDKGISNDDLIVDCALYYSGGKGVPVAIISADRNLCTTVASQQLPAICPKDRKFLHFSSRTLAGALYDWNQAIVRHFPDNTMKPRSRNVQRAFDDTLPPDITPIPHTSDDMDLDDAEDGDPLPSHLLDILHVQIIDHFGYFLLNLVKRVSPRLFIGHTGNGSSASIHSPARVQEPESWTARNCVEHLTRQALFTFGAGNGWKSSEEAKEMISTVKQGSTRLAAFLTKRYERGAPSRSGQEWAREDWIYCLTVLKCIGQLWKDEHVLASLTTLSPHLDDAFATPMRPTGT